MDKDDKDRKQLTEERTIRLRSAKAVALSERMILEDRFFCVPARRDMIESATEFYP